jgi:hypothetical protein
LHIYLFKEKPHVKYNSDCSAHFDVAWCIANLASQQAVGILSQWRDGFSPFDYCHPDIDGPILDLWTNHTQSHKKEIAMKSQMKELQKLKGIGQVLSHRLIESSYDTIAKVAGANEKGLEKIAGFNPQKVRSVTLQARKMTGEAEKSHHSWSEHKN